MRTVQRLVSMTNASGPGRPNFTSLNTNSLSVPLCPWLSGCTPLCELARCTAADGAL
jgi:hypothetical protein